MRQSYKLLKTFRLLKALTLQIDRRKWRYSVTLNVLDQKHLLFGHTGKSNGNPTSYVITNKSSYYEYDNVHENHKYLVDPKEQNTCSIVGIFSN